jgi:hypothetical protein
MTKHELANCAGDSAQGIRTYSFDSRIQDMAGLFTHGHHVGGARLISNEHIHTSN